MVYVEHHADTLGFAWIFLASFLPIAEFFSPSFSFFLQFLAFLPVNLSMSVEISVKFLWFEYSSLGLILLDVGRTNTESLIHRFISVGLWGNSIDISADIFDPQPLGWKDSQACEPQQKLITWWLCILSGIRRPHSLLCFGRDTQGIFTSNSETLRVRSSLLLAWAPNFRLQSKAPLLGMSCL